MKRRHFVVLVSAITLLTIVFVAVVTIGVGVGTDAGREQIRSIIEQQVGSRVNGKIHIGRIRSGFFTGITIDSFAIRGMDDSIFVSTGRVSLEYDPRDLLDRRLLLKNVHVEHPVFRLQQYEKGDWNFQRIFKSDDPSTPSVPGRNFGDFVVLDSVRVRNGEFIITRAWSPNDSLRGAKRDSSIRRNLARQDREIRRSSEGLTHTYRWSRASGFLPHVRIAHPDSGRFGQLFVIDSLSVDEQEPPFSFRHARGTVQKLGDSVFIDVKHFDLPASTGSAQGKIWWGNLLPIRVDVRIVGDSVSLKDVAWVYPTLPREGGGRTKVRITNNKADLHNFEYALTEMDVRSTKSRLTGAMTFVVGGPVLEVRSVDLRAAPVNFDLLRTLAGEDFSVDWQGDLTGYARGPGGPLTHFVVDESEMTWRDSHVRGAVTRLKGRGELDILEPAFTSFHGFDVDVESADLRSIEYLFPAFPKLGGTVSGVATLDSSWLDVRFSKANVTHSNGPGDPTRVTGSGRVTWAKEFMTYDVAVNAEPLSLDMMSRAYPLGLKGLLSGPIQAKGTTNDLQLTAQLQGPAGRITYAGTVDTYPLSIAARGSGRVDALDLSRLVAKANTPQAVLTGTYQLDVRADTNDIGTLHGSATALLERSQLDGMRVFPSRMRARFADGRMYVDTLLVESVAARITASGALGLTSRVSDSLQYVVTVDSLGGLRRYVEKLTSNLSDAQAAMADSISGSVTLAGTARGSLRSLDLSGQLTGTSVFVRREAGKEITGAFALANLQGGPTGTASIRFRALNLGGMKLDTLGASVRFEAAGSGAFTIGALAVNGVTLAASGDLAMADSQYRVMIRDLNLVTDSSRWTLRGISTIQQLGRGFAIDSLVLANGRGARVALEGIVPAIGRARILLQADSVPLHDVGRIAQLRKSLSGWAQVAAQGAGTSGAPVMNMQATLRDLHYGGVSLERVTATAEYLNNRAAVALELALGARTALIARGSLPIRLQYFGAQLLDDSLRATIRTDSASLGIIEAIVPGLRNATGSLTANIDIAGSWKHPDATGAFRVENGEVSVDSLGIRVRGIHVDAQLFGHADSLAIRRFVGWSGTSAADSLSLSGYVAYRDLSNPYLNLRLDARTFRALDRRSLARLDVSTESNGVRLRGQLRGATLTGALIVDRGTFYLPDPEIARKEVVDFTATLRDTAFADSDDPSGSSRLLESIIIDGVRVTLGDEVWLRSREANIKLGGTLNVQRGQKRGLNVAAGSPAARASSLPELDGEVRAERGTYTLALGLVQREFTVGGGTIAFFGTGLDPELDITALHTVRTADKADLRVRVRLKGPLKNPIVILESAESFALSQSDLVSYLVFGQPNFVLGSKDKTITELAVQTLAPSLQTVAAAQLRNWVGAGGDFLLFQPGSTTANRGSDNNNNAFGDILWTSRLGYEKQLTDQLFVNFTTGLCGFRQAEQSGPTNEWLEGLSGKLEFRLSRDASIKAGKEPSAMSCRPSAVAGRVVPTPSQWGLSLFKTWRF